MKWERGDLLKVRGAEIVVWFELGQEKKKEKRPETW